MDLDNMDLCKLFKYSSSLVIFVKNPYRSFSSENLYLLLKSRSRNSKFILKQIDHNKYMVIPLDADSLKEIVLNIPSEIIIGFSSLGNLVERSMNSIMNCNYIRIRSETPVIIDWEMFKKLIEKFQPYVVEFSIEKIKEYDGLRFNIIVKNDPCLTEYLICLKIFGLGKKRESGYGSIELECIKVSSKTR